MIPDTHSLSPSSAPKFLFGRREKWLVYPISINLSLDRINSARSRWLIKKIARPALFDPFHFSTNLSGGNSIGLILGKSNTVTPGVENGIIVVLCG